MKENGKLALDFDGTDDELSSTTVPFSGTTHRTSFTVSNADTATSADIIYGIDGGNASAPTGELWQLTSETQLRVSGRIEFNNSAQTIHSLGTLIFNGTTVDDANFYLNGSLTTQGTSTGATINTGSTNFGIGTTVVSTSNYDGKQQELIFYASDKSTDRTDIEENIGDYFTQNTPLLDTYTGAAACYSLRLMRTAYTGSDIRVRRSSDNTEQDINFNVFGELDTVSLLAFAGTGDAFVKTWYDQSGNSNDATQTTTANQPKIYDGTTGVETSNGKPAVRFINSSATYLDAPSLGADTTTTYFEVHDRNGSNLNVWSPDRNVNAVCADGLTFISGTPYLGVTALIGGSLKQPTTAGDIQDYRLVYWLRNGTNSELGVNASTVVTGTQSSSVLNRLRLGTRAGLQSPFDGYMSEFVMYRNDQSSNRTNIETNIATFYDITI